jgi:hypothetical protein
MYWIMEYQKGSPGLQHPHRPTLLKFVPASFATDWGRGLIQHEQTHVTHGAILMRDWSGMGTHMNLLTTGFWD